MTIGEMMRLDNVIAEMGDAGTDEEGRYYIVCRSCGCSFDEDEVVQVLIDHFKQKHGAKI